MLMRRLIKYYKFMFLNYGCSWINKINSGCILTKGIDNNLMQIHIDIIYKFEVYISAQTTLQTKGLYANKHW